MWVVVVFVYFREQVMYLAVRNTVLALWALHPKVVCYMYLLPCY